ncbi:MAG: NAD(P)H-dependent oxidoreductase [Verrucomicrobiaceae bacterium]|nr:NAD(P)H-dependent oxidoreductase [Verrucomicrobiaceae bacterium]
MHSSEILAALQWRYATKVFDPAKKIPADTWAALEESLVLTPSSYGLQPWKFLVIQDVALREQLLPHTWRQRQVVDSSHLVVMAVKTSFSEADIDAFLTRMVEVRGGSADALAGFRKMLLGTFQQGYMTKEWAKMQAYIALGQFMTSCALLQIDTCPMEGFVPAKYDEILDLGAHGLTTAVLCPAGYRHADDRYAALPKVRFDARDVIEHR